MEIKGLHHTIIEIKNYVFPKGHLETEFLNPLTVLHRQIRIFIFILKVIFKGN